jgi:hypothetical protein
VQYSVCYNQSAIQCMVDGSTIQCMLQCNTVYVTIRVQYSVWSMAVQYSVWSMAVQYSVCYSAIQCMVQYTFNGSTIQCMLQCNTLYGTITVQYSISYKRSTMLYYNNSKVQATPDGEEDAKIKMRKLSNNVKISRIKCCHQMYRSIAILKTQL